MEPLRARTLPDLVRAGAEHHGDREAIVDGPARLSSAGLALPRNASGKVLKTTLRAEV